MPQMTCMRFGSDRLNGAKVEKRDRHTDGRTDLRSLLLGYGSTFFQKKIVKKVKLNMHFNAI